jgi:serine phosphatase RsbU (regulator of sigma subunit)
LVEDWFKAFVDQFKSSESAALADVRAYKNWLDQRKAGVFSPSSEDDVDIRTYLSHLLVTGARRDRLEQARRSLAQLYAWAKREGLIDANPFDEYDFKRPFLTRSEIRRRRDVFTGTPAEREIARLRALNSLAIQVNRSADVRGALEMTLQTLSDAMHLKSAWGFVLAESGLVYQVDRRPLHDFLLAADHNLPPGLKRKDFYYLRKPGDCHCQFLLRSGRLDRAVNIVECSRLQESAKQAGDNRGLLFHASLPVRVQGQAVGVLNFATHEWQFLSAADLQLLSTAGEYVSSALERARLYDHARRQKSRLKRELNMARSVQASLIPKTLPELVSFRLAATWRSAREVAGDFYDVFQFSDGHWGILVADVADKGAPAALYMAITRSLVRTHAARLNNPGDLLKAVNQELNQQNSSGMFVTVFCAAVESHKGKLSYALAGHNPPLVRRISGKVETLERGGPAMGVFPQANYQDLELELSPGDTLLVYTDGVTDALNTGGDDFGMQRLTAAVAAAPGMGKRVLDHVLQELEAFCGPAVQFDDITLFAIGRENEVT